MFGDDDDNDRDENEGGAGPSGTGSTAASRDDSNRDDDSQQGNASGTGIDNTSFGGSSSGSDSDLGSIAEGINDDFEDDFGSFTGGDDFNTGGDGDGFDPNVLGGGVNSKTPEQIDDERNQTTQQNQLRAVAAAVSDTLPDTASPIAKKKKPIVLGIPGNIGLRQNSLF